MLAVRALVLSAIIPLVGCAHSGANFARLNTVKTAAIVGFSGEVDITDPNQRGRVSGTMGAIQGISDVGSEETGARRLQEAKDSYDALVEKLSKGTEWNILPRDTVAANPAMQALFKEKMGERRPYAGIRMGIPNILWYEFGSDLSKEEQQALKAALGVDVLLVARMNFKSGRTYGATGGGEGVADVYPQAILAFQAFDAGDGAVWNERWVEGPIAQGSVRSTMGTVDTTNEVKVVQEAAGLVSDTLVQKYQEQKAKQQPAPVPSGS